MPRHHTATHFHTPGIIIIFTDEAGRTALHHAAAVSSKNVTRQNFAANVITKLLSCGANFSAVTQSGQTSLHVACISGSVHAVKTLLAKKDKKTRKPVMALL